MNTQEQMQGIDEMLVTMAKQTRSMMEQAKLVLENNRKDKALFIVESDAHINNLELEINETAVLVLSNSHPVASDLRRVLSAIKIANDLERIGDYAKNIARYVIKNEEFPQLIMKDAQDMFVLFFNNFDQAIKVVENDDVPLAYQTAEADEKIDEALKNIATKVDTSNDGKLEMPFATIGLLRNIERAGDHTTNICEHVIYRTKSQYVDFG
jgi:phosphate transport system protein